MVDYALGTFQRDGESNNLSNWRGVFAWLAKASLDGTGLGRPSKRFTFQHGGKNTEGTLAPFISCILCVIACYEEL